MAGTMQPGNPTPLNVRQMLAAGTGGATGVRRSPMVTVSVPIPQSIVAPGTGNGNFLSWINPEVGTIIVTSIGMYLTTTGTGTVDIGVGDDGTGSNNNIFQAGTMNTAIATPLVAIRGLTGTEGAGSGGKATWWALGPGGTGTSNSLVGKTNEVTSTAVGRLVIVYVPLT